MHVTKVFSVATAIGLTLGAAACSAGSVTTTSHGVKAVKPVLTRDAQTVQASVENVQVALGLAIKDSSQANVDQLAQVAQQAHDDLKNMKDEVAVDTPAGSNISGELYGAVDELKNAMGALVKYTGTPNPATLASFTSQWQTGVADWNQAVTDLYKGTSGNPPTISTS